MNFKSANMSFAHHTCFPLCVCPKLIDFKLHVEKSELFNTA